MMPTDSTAKPANTLKGLCGPDDPVRFSAICLNTQGHPHSYFFDGLQDFVLEVIPGGHGAPVQLAGIAG